MLKRLVRQAAEADLASVEALLGVRREEDDPVGYLQFSRRAEDLARQLREIEDAPTTGAEVGLFFGGRPVVGSYGIQAEFAGRAVAEFQTLVSSAFAAADGSLGTRGPVPQRDKTQLLLTDVARGSFGLILQQADDLQLVDSPMKAVVADAIDLVFRLASPDQKALENLAEDVDSRVFSSLKSFFKVLDDAGATLRIVEDSREFTLHREDVSLARERTERLTLSEDEEVVTGTLYVLPESRRFELHPIGGANALRGNVDRACLANITGGGSEVRPGLIGTVQTVRVRTREIAVHGYDPRKSYTLLAIAPPSDLGLTA